MGLGDMARKAKDALSGEQGERVLDRGADLANKATGGKYADKIDQGRESIGERLGDREDEQTGVDGVNAVGTAGGSGRTSGTTTAGATSPGPETDAATGRHRADGEPDASSGPGAGGHRA